MYVLALKCTIPSEIPALSTIEAKVSMTANAKSHQLIQQAAIMFDVITNALTKGENLCRDLLRASAETRIAPAVSSGPGGHTFSATADFRPLPVLGIQARPAQPARTHPRWRILLSSKALPVDEAKIKREMPRFLL